ncbi:MULTISPECIES: magnesium transporter [unclassified Thermosynechococcus]|uniref:magnesium transporter n=1 Tax=unclassified Thermosynechococcus TaxID=2622553 RepID=UPI002673970F|nr:MULTISPECIES: magnesium transporter [unclassified Thermosynechococcus]WKT83938.1 magnesium transporter [Thermosynechococcus sp. HY596]WNC63071.1 magnesium transporter [Thermosynechococcus sp. HY591]WNC65630.1 magnesium transporter [Thermosynechococcus sp. HY593]
MVINPLDDLLTYPQGLGAAKRTANQLTIPELVRALRQIDPHKRVLAFRLLEKDKAIAVFEALTPDEQATLIEGMTDPEILHFLEALEADQRVRLFEELPAKVTKRLLSQLSSESRDAVNLLLGYPEGTIGRRMNLRYLALRQDLTVEQAIAAIRESSLDINDLSIIFVIDEQRFYRGFVQPIQLMKANPHQPLQDLVQGQELAIAVTAPELAAAKLLKEYDVPAIPVVDQEGRLVGDITFDDVIDLIEEEATSTILAQAGVGNLLNRDQAWSERLVRGPIRYAVQLRIICLIITLIGGMIVGGVIQYFEEVLEAVVAVAIFIPVVMDMGGNVGTQSTTVFARGLAWQHIDIRRYGGYLFREFRIGAIMGLILGTAGGLIALVWQGLPNDIPQLGLAVGISLFVVITFAAILGALLPWVLLKLGFDHGPAADPFITTIKDFTGLLLYFYLVSVFLGLSF